MLDIIIGVIVTIMVIALIFCLIFCFWLLFHVFIHFLEACDAHSKGYKTLGEYRKHDKNKLP